MIVKLLTDHHLRFLNQKGGCTGSSESTLVKMPNCWKSHAAAYFQFYVYLFPGRPEKLPDVCYSWWVLSSLKIIGKLHWIDKVKFINESIINTLHAG